MKPLICFFIFAFIFSLLLAINANGQQTIFNVPTTDALDAGKVYVELDAAFKLNGGDTVGPFSSLVPRVVIGVGGDVEIGLNLTGNIQPGADSTTLVPTVKWKFYKNEHQGIALIAGNNFYIPVRNRAYNFGIYTYVGGSKSIKKTRFTAAGYVASENVFAPNASRGGGQFGIEHTVNDKFTLAADWITGRHSSGYFTPGVIYKPHTKVTAYWSYSIGNDDAVRGNHYFLFELGYNIN